MEVGHRQARVENALPSCWQRPPFLKLIVMELGLEKWDGEDTVGGMGFCWNF